MLFLRQTWALMLKNLLVCLVRHPITTPFRAFLLPVIFIAFLSYARFLFLPASTYGIGSPVPVPSLLQAIDQVSGGRNKLVFVSAFDGGPITTVIDDVSSPILSSTVEVVRLNRESELREVCRNTILGTSTCIAAAVFYSSPSEGQGGIWNYSIRADGALGSKIQVDSSQNDAQIYILPLQYAIDAAIVSRNTSARALPSTVDNYPYTSRTAEQRQQDIRKRYMGGIVDILGVAFYIGMVGVSYQLTGLVTREREIGMSQLLDSTMPNIARWQPQAARIFANHVALDVIYFPGWVVMAVILFIGVFAETSPVIMLVTNILAGLATSSFAIFAAGFFERAQLSGTFTVIGLMVLSVLAQVVNKAGTATYAILSILFPPINYVFFIITMARFERQGIGMNLVKAAPEHTSSLPGLAFWIFFILQIPIYPLIGALFENLLYGTSSKKRRTHIEAGSVAISIRSLSVQYRPKIFTRLANLILRRPAKIVAALRDLDLDLRRGEILVYLGANGSGKSTTLNSIAGLLSNITSGGIDINYADHNTSLGLCPQGNVLWDDLTVLEHVQIFNRIKSVQDISLSTGIQSLLQSCDIDRKQDARSKTLSGGQKRKLQLAMMFIGNSKICCVDEVSSGLDPLSRRKIWDILLAERGSRSILLTTHFLDEADVLADHIAIISRGSLKAYGTSVELKTKLGSGYRVHVLRNANSQQHQILGMPHVQRGDELEFTLPGSAQTLAFARRLEDAVVAEYQISGPTIEDVFLRVAEETQSPSEALVKKPPLMVRKDDTVTKLHTKPEKLGTLSSLPPPVKDASIPELSTGRPISMARQAFFLFRKRILVTRRSPLPLAAALLIPIIGAGLVSLFLKDYSLPGCDPQAIAYSPDISSFLSQVNFEIVAGPSSVLTAAGLLQVAQTLTAGTDSNTTFVANLARNFTLIDTYQALREQITTNYANITPGGFYAAADPGPPTFAWKGNGAISNAPLILNLLDNLMSSTSIATQYQAFDIPWPSDAGKALQMITYFGLCLAVAPAFFALYPNLERLRNVRNLHYSNGVRALPLWLAYVAFDFIFVLLLSAISTIILVSISQAWYHIGYLFVVLMLYGLSSILLSYTISLFSRSQLAAWSFAAAGQCVAFLVYFIVFMSILTYVEPSSQTTAIRIAHFVIAAIAPIANVQRALFIGLNIFSQTCENRQLMSYPGDILGYGGPILYLILQSLVLLGILVWWDDSSLYRRLRNRRPRPDSHLIASDEPLPNDSAPESSATYGLQVNHISKQFKKTLALDDVSFQVSKGEVFALLGVNGAGKSTCISLIRGDLHPSKRGGDILVDDVSIIDHRAQARSKLGVCPQFDAMDTMTVQEHLKFYAQIKGVRDPDTNTRIVMEAIGLTSYADRMAAKLSGGNKRKLSLGIALMGNPAVLLLDEPSSGMDAASKRVMWKILAQFVPNRSLVLTTHSMEEADALADRAGILAGRMLASGTTESLRQRYGDCYYVHLVASSAPHTSDQEMSRIRDWTLRNIPNSRFEDRTYHGQLRLEVPLIPSSRNEPLLYLGDEKSYRGGDNSQEVLSISNILEILERAKVEIDIEHYTVSRATLDQIFLKIVTEHNVIEDIGPSADSGAKQSIFKNLGKLMRKSR